MYKFLVCVPQADAHGSDWLYSYNSRMYPNFDNSVKEAILVGYYSRAQDKWITSGTSIHLVEDYRKVRKAFPDTEMCLIVLGNDISDKAKDNVYFRSFPSTPPEYI
jgi:hypothetical protein